MKKIIGLILTAAMILSIAALMGACGDTVTLESKTVSGLSIKVPSDFGEFTEINTLMTAQNEDKTANINVSPSEDATGSTADMWTKDLFNQNVLNGFSESEVLSFDNSGKVAGLPAVSAHYKATNNSGVVVEGYSFFIYHTDGTFQSVAFTFNPDTLTSLESNINEIIASIALAG